MNQHYIVRNILAEHLSQPLSVTPVMENPYIVCCEHPTAYVGVRFFRGKATGICPFCRQQYWDRTDELPEAGIWPQPHDDTSHPPAGYNPPAESVIAFSDTERESVTLLEPKEQND